MSTIFFTILNALQYPYNLITLYNHLASQPLLALSNLFQVSIIYLANPTPYDSWPTHIFALPSFTQLFLHIRYPSLPTLWFDMAGCWYVTSMRHCPDRQLLTTTLIQRRHKLLVVISQARVTCSKRDNQLGLQSQQYNDTFNLLAPWRRGCNLGLVIFKPTRTGTMTISCEISLSWTPCCTRPRWWLVHIGSSDWCPQTDNKPLSQCWPSSMTPYMTPNQSSGTISWFD